jgi:hypothetical protein
MGRPYFFRFDISDKSYIISSNTAIFLFFYLVVDRIEYA